MSDALRVSESRRNKKQRLVYVMGGKCCLCGYSRCNAALEFHHKNPSEKDTGVSKIGNKRISVLLKEVEKCILVCSNCHKEIHSGLISENVINGINCFDKEKAKEVELLSAKNGGKSDIDFTKRCERCGVEIFKQSKLCRKCENEKRKKKKQDCERG